MIDPDLVWLGAAATVVLLPATGVLIYQRVKSRRKPPAAQTTLLRLRQRRR